MLMMVGMILNFPACGNKHIRIIILFQCSVHCSQQKNNKHFLRYLSMNHNVKTNSIDLKQIPVGLSNIILVIADISIVKIRTSVNIHNIQATVLVMSESD